MKNLINKYKRCLTGTSLLLALIGLTSFNPFSQGTHLAQLNLQEGSIELAAVRANPEPGNLPERARSSAQTTREVLDKAAVDAGTSYVASGTNDNKYTLAVGGEAIGTQFAGDTLLYVTKMERIAGVWKVFYKVEASKQLEVEGSTCAECKEAITAEHYLTLSDLNAAAFLRGDAQQRDLVFTALRTDFNEIRKGLPSSQKSTELAEAFECDQESYEARYACLQSMKKKICTRSQERRGDENCITKEDYEDEIYALVEDVALDDTLSDAQFRKISRLVRRDGQASSLIRTISEQRNFKRQALHFERSVGRSLDQIGRIDDKIAQLNQHWGNPWAMQQVAALEQQKKNIAVTVEKQADMFKQHYQRSSLASTRPTNGIYSELTLDLKQDLEETYSSIMAPMADLFFDPTVASLDRVEYAGPNTGNLARSGNGQFQNPPSLDQNSWTSSQQLASNDPRFSNGYISNGPQLIGNRSTARWDVNSPIVYNPQDPNLVGGRRYVNPPRIQQRPGFVQPNIPRRQFTNQPGWT